MPTNGFRHLMEMVSSVSFEVLRLPFITLILLFFFCAISGMYIVRIAGRKIRRKLPLARWLLLRPTCICKETFQLRAGYLWQILL